MIKLTDKHFKIFVGECGRWIDKLKIDNWKVYYRWQESKENRATISTKLGGYVATIFLSKKWCGEKVTEDEVKESAKHEVIHLLLARMSTNGGSRFVSQYEVDESEEELVQKLEKLL